MAAKTIVGHIECTPGTLGGKPRIAGRRITVENIVNWHENQGMSPDEIAAEYDLSLGEIYGALSYYFDHREEIDRRKQENDDWIQALRKKSPSIVQRKLKEKGLTANGRNKVPAGRTYSQGRRQRPAPKGSGRGDSK